MSCFRDYSNSFLSDKIRNKWGRGLIFLSFFLAFGVESGLSQGKTESELRNVPVKVDNFNANIQVLNIDKNKKELNENLTYFWFKNNEVHKTQGGVGGKLLHGAYVVYYDNKNLKEQGSFKYGLKNGKWTEWYENNKIKSVCNWQNGLLHGRCTDYNEDGTIAQQSLYKNGLLHGEKIVYKNGLVESKTIYIKGKIVENNSKNEKKQKKCFLKGIFSKKD